MGFALASDEPDESCTCMLLDRPDVLEKEKRARWMVHSLNYGVLSTISTRLPGSPPFGNVYSFVDGDCSSSSGVPYFYGTYMDQSFECEIESKCFLHLERGIFAQRLLRLSFESLYGR